MALELNGLLVGPLTLVPSAASEGVTVKTDLTYFSRHPGGEALVYFQIGFVHTGEFCCRKTFKLLAGAFPKSWTGKLHECLIQLFESPDFSLEI